MLLMFAIGSLYAWSVFVLPLERNLGLSRSAISSIFSLAIVCFTLFMLIGPQLYRYAGAPTIALLTCLAAAVGLVLAGWDLSFYAIALGYGGLFGTANGLGYGLSIQVVQNAFSARRGLVTGLAVASYTLGSAIFAPLFSAGIEVLGIGTTFVVTGAFMALVGIAAFVLLRVSRVDIQPPSSIPSHRPMVQSKGLFWALWFGFFFGAFAGVMVLGHAAAIVGSFGATPEQIVFGASMVGIGNGIGRLGGGWFSDRVAPRRILTTMLLLAGLALLVVATVPAVAVSIVALTIVGVGYGTMAGAYPVVISQIYGVANVSKIYGRVFIAWGLAGVGGPARWASIEHWSSLAARLSEAFSSTKTAITSWPSSLAQQPRFALGSSATPFQHRGLRLGRPDSNLAYPFPCPPRYSGPTAFAPCLIPTNE
jgi:OFA family oxalate/formate antiporter-like MFS transporter